VTNFRPRGILALDLGGCIGWAYCFPGNEPVWSHRFLPRESGPAAAFSVLRPWLFDRIAEFDPAVIAIEAPILNHHGKFKTAMPTAIKLIGFYAHVIQICDEKKIRHYSVSATEIKKFFTGDGWAKKSDMVAAAEQRGWKTVMDDEADALGLLMLCERRLSKVRRTVPVGELFPGQRTL
jgi:Holliday junction resolvasome RuvABC endonuclease subunit